MEYARRSTRNCGCVTPSFDTVTTGLKSDQSYIGIWNKCIKDSDRI